MTPLIRKLLLAMGVLGLAGLVCAEPPVPGIEDGARLFKPATLVQAREQIQAIRTTLHQDLSIETLPFMPPEDQQRVHGLSGRELDHYFDRWAKDRASAAGVDGVYILISNDPKIRHVQVIVWPESRDQTFPRRERNRLQTDMARHLGRDPDQTLLHAIACVRDSIQAHQPVEAPSTSGAWAVGGVIVALLLFWVVLGMWRAQLLARDRAMSVTGVACDSPFLPGLLGGMFGTVAGHWIYDRLFHGGPRQAALPAGNLPPEDRDWPSTTGEANVADDPAPEPEPEYLG